MLGSIQGKICHEDIMWALESVGLDPEDERTYGKYSLGMKQKLGIANAILGKPDIIVLDEPINALDEDSVARVKKVLIGLREESKLIIIVCHDKEELDYLCDEVYIMHEGKIIGKEVITDAIS
jgi:ABC-2 type transport system ATP-binding protein